MKVEDFNFELPEELIAQDPIKERTDSRLLVLNKKTGKVDHKIFKDIIECLNPNDCLVLNNTKVIPARLIGIREKTGAKIEFLLLNRQENDQWEVMVKPGKKVVIGERIIFGEGLLIANILEKLENGNRIIQFEYKGIFEQILDELGEMPLPPYISHQLEDKDRYQTVYAKHAGSAAAPTAGLHFTNELLEKIKGKGVEIAYITLHVGIGTFRPVKVDNIEEHDMHSEFYWITEEEASKINNAKAKGGRVIAVGTTSCRTLETVANDNGTINESKGWTDIFIYPGYKYKMVDALITNFHLPESTLIMLVSALAGKENVMGAYQVAIENKYRFYSFGDAMMIL
ncbi:S-adenosylmethionine:tRNA ribosyltransferase-isomerase [Natranaerovirga pectinivora]|uniref:S-adenosylmethionine:tRNA ribosyltransferase-isomerase n=1 Tax=Natranaerovirga pectinivora TaxID=682400 RepID=A0A4V2V0B9_9FIRM|nr:tRNA preQ1(34) S-adenosylmethionine ribosyltransferase-isomerase QueA [Natranaerovirga pectinivora]TCT15350.1 S-adenosylmethionine:tRNA ribosyltransferase-isomerase [Natranaerovirga pectinivora]